MKPLVLSVIAILAAGSAMAAVGVADWSGVYKQRFNVTGPAPGVVEDVLEIVPVGPNRAYVRADLSFSSANSCKFYGVATLEGDRLRYRGPVDGHQGERCTLTLERGRDAKGNPTIVLRDEGSRCEAATCSKRGSYDTQSFPVSARRTIRYMPRLKASSEFAYALKEAGIAAPPATPATRPNP
ncbi:hypothetical protein CA606_08855 [Caulobacter vibrioides]|uniref:Uncharacterized protein n=1 Tax=Caulobacter vibrioides TaxID=155892 RepID=A0A290MKC3_CAUVI|nr:hypothetical protein [Caulobacter vibrioides]ATC32448.1 hypothetical protein CA606_08855 [Caulobacter vibrioides]